MENIIHTQNIDPITGEVSHWVTIENADGGFTSMSKAHYEAQQVEHLTEIPTPTAE